MTKNNVSNKKKTPWLSLETLPFSLQCYCEAGWGGLEYGRYQKQYCTWKELGQITPRDSEKIIGKYFSEKIPSNCPPWGNAPTIARLLNLCDLLTSLLKILQLQVKGKTTECFVTQPDMKFASICLQQCLVISDASIRRI